MNGRLVVYDSSIPPYITIEAQVGKRLALPILIMNTFRLTLRERREAVSEQQFRNVYLALQDEQSPQTSTFDAFAGYSGLVHWVRLLKMEREGISSRCEDSSFLRRM